MIQKTRPWVYGIQTEATGIRSLDPMEELTAKVINQAINDGLLNDWDGIEARTWVRNEIGPRVPNRMREIERFWEYPFCKCGRRLVWPERKCASCRSSEAAHAAKREYFRLTKERRGL